MEELLPYAEKIAALLKSRNETIAIAESSAGGLITAALLAVPGASAYCIGSAVLYTRKSMLALTAVEPDALAGLTPGTEAASLFRAQLIRKRLETTWGISETGVAGPTGSRYGYAPGHACVAVSGPVERARTVETASPDRVRNMYAFATAALELLAGALSER
ncbi:MAG TPA: CinA family protein [Burkholderiales bacterium]|nr:CinA family protein [Burkholderiales bacterium]